MIFFFQFLPLLLPINQTFLCHNASVPLIINDNDTNRILDVEINIRVHTYIFFIKKNILLRIEYLNN